MPAFSRIDPGDAALVWWRNYDVYVRLWRTELIAPLFEPFFTVIGLGWGVGSLIAGKVMGVPYLTYFGAGLLAFASLIRALIECTYGSYFRMVYQSTFDAILCTPIEAESLALGEIVWGMTKALIDGFFVLLVLWGFGAILSPWGLLIPLVLGLAALWVAAVALIVTSRTHDINSYNFLFAITFSYLWVSGGYFPLANLAEWVQVLAWLVPVTSAIDASRALMIGELGGWFLAQILFLLGVTLVTIEIALRSFRRRMIV
jgi:lipooligosaccharide transport system permease protein